MIHSSSLRSHPVSSPSIEDVTSPYALQRPQVIDFFEGASALPSTTVSEPAPRRSLAKVARAACRAIFRVLVWPFSALRRVIAWLDGTAARDKAGRQKAVRLHTAKETAETMLADYVSRHDIAALDADHARLGKEIASRQKQLDALYEQTRSAAGLLSQVEHLRRKEGDLKASVQWLEARSVGINLENDKLISQRETYKSSYQAAEKAYMPLIEEVRKMQEESGQIEAQARQLRRTEAELAGVVHAIHDERRRLRVADRAIQQAICHLKAINSNSYDPRINTTSTHLRWALSEIGPV